MTYRIAASPKTLPETIGLSRLFEIGFCGSGYGDIIAALTKRVEADAGDAAALFDLGTILMLSDYEAEGLDCHAEAFKASAMFRQPATGRSDALRLLMVAAPGGLMANTPAHFLLDGSGITLDTLYVTSPRDLPDPLPAHDVALVGIGESDENAPLLTALASHFENWPRPVLNRPADVLKLAREQLWQTLQPARGIHVPPTARLDRAALEALGRGETSPADLLGDAAYPIIARPVGSHAGHGLKKLDTSADVAAYCNKQAGDWFSISPFVDYSGARSMFRKYRIAMIDGRAYVCHIAIGERWMLHYLNAGMERSAAKRAEEGRLMAEFDDGFAVRHGAALDDLARLAGLDYFIVDCAETPDGQLLIFEADTAMIVHDMDPPALYPYKGPQMAKLFAAFRDMLHARAAGSVIGAKSAMDAAA